MDLKKIELAYEHAMSLSSSERETYLENLRATEPEFAAELERLIRDTSISDTILKQPIEASAARLSEEMKDPWIGRVLGAYRIIDRIAAGGMGAVFLAERKDEQFEHRVAIKVMSEQLLASDAVARFKTERQILANLKHPYIAQLHDGGTTDNGLPYLVMEYVEGQPIDRHCDNQGLDIDQRLYLFQKVCEAVDYAHRNLTVHRDLKPSNILIDSRGDPKLLDFGIAKLLDERSVNEAAPLTRVGQRAMTPEYASPEQVRGEPVSVASDVYALGVLLFRLLTGQSPYGGNMTTPGSYERAILEAEPRRPSAAVTVANEAKAAAESSGTSVAQLRRYLVGDLDNITMRALQKAPERRYRSVADFSRDIARHQSHKPIEARADDWWYRSRKFLRRHAARVAITTAVLSAGIALVTFYTLRLADERDFANQSAAEAREIAAFLTTLFEGSSSNIQAGKEVTAVDLLEEGRRQIDALEDQPELQAKLMHIMASSSTTLGRYDVSIPMLERSLELQEALSPVDEEAISRTTHALSAAHRQNGDLQQAAEYERRTIELAIRVFGEDHYNVAYLRMRLGVILFDQGLAEESLAMKQDALDQLIAIGSGDSTAALDARGNISLVLSHLGRHEEAAVMAGEVAKLSVPMQGQDHPNTIIRTTNYANSLRQLGQLDEALSLLEDNIPRGIAVWGRDYYHVAYMLQVRGAIKRQAGDFASALDDYREAQGIIMRITEEDNYRRADAWRGLGAVFASAGQFEEARDSFQRALAIAERVDGGERRIPSLYIWLGKVTYDAGDLAASRQWYAAAEAHAGLAIGALRLALKTGQVETLTALGELDAAAPLVETLLALEDSVPHLEALTAATAYFRARSDCDNALSTGERIKAIFDAGDQPMVWGDALALSEYGLALSDCGRPEARDVLMPAIDVLSTALGSDDSRVVRLQSNVPRR